MVSEDEKYMMEALTEAKKAAEADEVPVGAVIVRDGEIITRAFNSRETDRMPTAHAEIKVIQQAAAILGGWRLTRCTLYVTMEPCVMCAGAIINARIPRVVFGAYDKRFGGMGSIYSIQEGLLNHTPEVTPGVLESKCSGILSEYFKKKRKDK